METHIDSEITADTEPLPELDFPAAPDLDRIMSELDSKFGHLPVEAIRAAQQNRDAIIPQLIESIRVATAKAREGSPPTRNAHFFALFLLTEFRAKEAWPAIWEAVSLPDEGPFDLFGDSITETLPVVIATLVGDRPGEIDDMIRNRSLNEYLRWEAVNSYRCLAATSRMTRDEAVARLRPLLREAIENKDEEIVGPMICVLAELQAREARDEICQAFEMGLVDEMLIDLKSIDRDFAANEAEIQKRLNRWNQTISDTVTELEGWWEFSEDAGAYDDSYGGLDSDSDLEDDLGEEFDNPLRGPLFGERRSSWGKPSRAEYASPSTIRNTKPHIGRNDPCPCGSGKKYKKCCGGRK